MGYPSSFDTASLADAIAAIFLFLVSAVVSAFAYLFKVKADKASLAAQKNDLQRQIDEKASKDFVEGLANVSRETREDVREIRKGIDTLVQGIALRTTRA